MVASIYGINPGRIIKERGEKILDKLRQKIGYMENDFEILEEE